VSAYPHSYRGRIAPSPTGLLHVGHARTFWTACTRARNAGGTLILRNEDLDPQRSKAEFVDAMLDDLNWLGIVWQEGPDAGGTFGPYSQSERREHYIKVWKQLLEAGFLYPCTCSRRELTGIAQAPHEDSAAGSRLRWEGDEGPMYPGTCRSRGGPDLPQRFENPAGVHWRFRVPEGEAVAFDDGYFGPRRYLAGEDFGDFPVWRRDDVPAYQLAVVADDHAMQITEVVRGADLLLSTARQILLYRALGWPEPRWYHCPLLLDERGERLAKRHDALAIRTLREQGKTPAEVLGIDENAAESAHGPDPAQ
jgi:glutamyl/glutaminyl-tRNA synthetase